MAEEFTGALDLSEAYVRDVALPNLKEELPQALDRVALGLVGNGSECFGYDDELSCDHDWGVDFFVWVAQDDPQLIGELTAWKQRLFENNPPAFMRAQTDYGARPAVMTVSDFYRSLIGADQRPDAIQLWARVPEESLAMAVNGRVFHDGPGVFTKVREDLLAYYPEDLRLKRIATACMLAAQAGQYNFPRVAKRKDVVTMRRCIQRFTDQVEKLAFLINKQYRPYFKWTHRAMSELPILGQELAEELIILANARLDDPSLHKETEDRIERICIMLEDELKKQGLSDAQDAYMQAHGESVYSKIQDPMLRGIPITYEL